MKASTSFVYNNLNTSGFTSTSCNHYWNLRQFKHSLSSIVLTNTRITENGYNNIVRLRYCNKTLSWIHHSWIYIDFFSWLVRMHICFHRLYMPFFKMILTSLVFDSKIMVDMIINNLQLISSVRGSCGGHSGGIWSINVTGVLPQIVLLFHIQLPNSTMQK